MVIGEWQAQRQTRSCPRWHDSTRSPKRAFLCPLRWWLKNLWLVASTQRLAISHLFYQKPGRPVLRLFSARACGKPFRAAKRRVLKPKAGRISRIVRLRVYGSTTAAHAQGFQVRERTRKAGTVM